MEGSPSSNRLVRADKSAYQHGALAVFAVLEGQEVVYGDSNTGGVRRQGKNVEAVTLLPLDFDDGERPVSAGS